ncbi:MAG: type I-U CRISPR-associated helicase/endonuclease Cas3 [Acidobacteriia bacterium]|nr:type I-U CRISPR-associated helicase/endonuclease Cas3 [Methyloceanibacter sp.]MCL6492782.1 type I-U CRISPR-associated helicase/endonuclease Cas3 [Terriglobia bacterium]
MNAFHDIFRYLTGNAPLRWQQRLFDRFVAGNIPHAIDLPTGLGKTSVMAIWLIALALAEPEILRTLPRRLIYVVDRRTVVDQATDLAEKLRLAMKSAPEGSTAAQIRDRLSQLCIDPDDEASPLAISTLRGERADNREWQADPAHPAIIVGTVDMIGSRLLFSGYGVSRRMRPFHAGLLGQHTLLVHDEAHLSEPFGELVRSVIANQQARNALDYPLHLLELSATRRKPAVTNAFTLTDEDKAEGLVSQRLHASKRLRIEQPAQDESAAVTRAVELALVYRYDRKRVLVYVRKPRDAQIIADRLAKATDNCRVALLTGTVRGYERDQLAEKPLLRGFRSDPNRSPPTATEYLVATSAGEVGVDLDADHMVCDLSTLDSMIQRLGRVNRLGGKDRSADVHVVPWPSPKNEGEEKAIQTTMKALASLPQYGDGTFDASPKNLLALAHRTDAFAPTPHIVPLTDILLDNWSLTCVKHLPGRPMPDRWLHGVEGGEPELYVVWREEVNDLAACFTGGATGGIRLIKELYDKHPILARERLRGPMGAVREELKHIANSHRRESEQQVYAVLLPVNGDPVFDTLSALLERDADLPNATIILPTSAGGLDARGMLTREAGRDPAEARLHYDVADDDVDNITADAKDERRRLRILLTRTEEEGWEARALGQSASIIPDELAEKLAGTRSDREAARHVREHIAKQFGLVEKALLAFDRDEDGEPRRVLQLLSFPRSAATAQDDPAAAASEQVLDEHLRWVAREAEKIVERIGLKAANPDVAEAIVIAASWHDRGKNRPEWQKAIGNRDPAKPLAKSGQRGFDASACGTYRHEFGSLREAMEDQAIGNHTERDLILHLIAAHHGWARPHFEPEHGDFPVSDEQNAEIVAETMRRFARLQRRFGHWGLAWLEALLRAADYSATERL